MTVSCPSCDTVYGVAPRSQLDDCPTFRCSRCDHVFGPEDGGDEPLPAPAPLPQRAAHGVPDEHKYEEPGGADEGVQAPPRRRSSARLALRAVLVVTLGFALLSIYVFMHRTRVTEVLAKVPVVGPDLVALRLNPAHVQLTDVRGQFTRVHGDTLVFVITGRAIEIQGSITGTREQHRLVYAGAAPHHVDDLSQREIELLQTLQPPESWRLLPGEEGDFLVAFVDPPVPLRNFAVEVAAVRRRRIAITAQ